MSVNATTGIESTVTNADSTEAKIDALIETVEDQEQRITELEEENEDLRSQLAEEAKDHANTKQRVTELENAETTDDDGHTQGTNTENTDTERRDTPQTPLERTVALPQGIAESELTANQQRARFVARDVHEYTRSVPAGRAIKSSEIGTVLRAGTECKGRSQTVSRVIEFLNDFGGDGVEVVERRGERRVVFDDEAARRLSRVGGRDSSNGGVAEAGA